MEYEMAHRWWVVALRGVLAILVGVIAFLWPGAFWLALAWVFGAYALVYGSFALAAAMSGRDQTGRWLLALEGLAGIAAAVVTIVWPLITQLALFTVTAAWFLVSGMFEVVAAIRLRRVLPAWGLLVLSGILSVVFGVLLVLIPVAGMVVIAWWAGAYSIAFGILLIVLAFRLRGLGRHYPSQVRATT